MNENDVKREQAMRETAKTAHRRRRHLRWQFVLSLVILLLGILAALCVTVLFPVRTITVQGETRYLDDEIIRVSQIDTEDNILLLNTEDAAESVIELLPYIGECSVEKSILGDVTLTVAELDGVRVYQNGTNYCIVNEKNKVLETTTALPEELCLILGAPSASVSAGQSYTPDDAKQSEVLTALFDGFEQYELEVSRVDLSDANNLRFVVENRIMVEFGSKADLPYKLAHLDATLDSMSDSDEGTLDLTWWTTSKKDAYFRRGNILELIYGEGYVAPDTDTDDTASDDASSDDTASTEDSDEPIDQTYIDDDEPYTDSSLENDADFDEE